MKTATQALVTTNTPSPDVHYCMSIIITIIILMFNNNNSNTEQYHECNCICIIYAAAKLHALYQ